MLIITQINPSEKEAWISLSKGNGSSTTKYRKSSLGHTASASPLGDFYSVSVVAVGIVGPGFPLWPDNPHSLARGGVTECCTNDFQLQGHPIAKSPEGSRCKTLLYAISKHKAPVL